MFIKRGDGKILSVLKRDEKKVVDAIINSSDAVVDATEHLTKDDDVNSKTKKQFEAAKQAVQKRKSE